MLGLVADTAASPIELRLVPYGEPWSGGSGLCHFGVRVFSGLPSTSSVILCYGDLLAPPLIPIVPGSSCSNWIDGLGMVAIPGTVDAFGMSDFYVPILPGLAHDVLGLQAMLVSPGGVFATNALRVHVGGGL